MRAALLVAAFFVATPVALGDTAVPDKPVNKDEPAKGPKKAPDHKGDGKGTADKGPAKPEPPRKPRFVGLERNPDEKVGTMATPETDGTPPRKVGKIRAPDSEPPTDIGTTVGTHAEAPVGSIPAPQPPSDKPGKKKVRPGHGAPPKP